MKALDKKTVFMISHNYELLKMLDITFELSGGFIRQKKSFTATRQLAKKAFYKKSLPLIELRDIGIAFRGNTIFKDIDLTLYRRNYFLLGYLALVKQPLQRS